MNSSAQAPDAPAQLVRAGPADARTASVLRDDLVTWLRQVVELTPARLNDIIVSAYEALANCAEHAYAHRVGSGAMTLRASYDPGAHDLCVSVADRGTWHDPPDQQATRTRGRGIALMCALADNCTIEGHPHGTTVQLHYATSVTKV
jgi:anti-sigma regulatory factor (Ser/Thr protein kinase)